MKRLMQICRRNWTSQSPVFLPAHCMSPLSLPLCTFQLSELLTDPLTTFSTKNCLKSFNHCVHQILFPNLSTLVVCSRFFRNFTTSQFSCFFFFLRQSIFLFRPSLPTSWFPNTFEQSLSSIFHFQYSLFYDSDLFLCWRLPHSGLTLVSLPHVNPAVWLSPTLAIKNFLTTKRNRRYVRNFSVLLTRNGTKPFLAHGMCKRYYSGQKYNIKWYINHITFRQYI